MSIMSDKEIRNELLESNDPKGWMYSVGEAICDELTDAQAAMLAYYYYRNDPEALGKFFIEIMGSRIEKTMVWEIEKFKDKNDITIGQDDCSAYKEHRDLNPDHYK